MAGAVGRITFRPFEQAVQRFARATTNTPPVSSVDARAYRRRQLARRRRNRR
ncbi:hypothetical protein [Microcystis phage MinS1]|nr:hypothetical protein [Microcystis phage MinS1]